MVKKIKKRFILFNLIVIGIIFLIVFVVTLLSVFGGHTFGGHHAQGGLAGGWEFRLIFTFILFLVLALIASIFLANLAIRPIKEAWKKQLDFTADASHELRTPLAVIQTSLEIIMDNKEQTVESQEEWFSNIVLEQKRMAKLVEDLLTLSRGDTNEQVLEQEEIDFSEIMEITRLTMGAVAAKKGIQIEVRDAGNVSFIGDEKRIQQLFVILVDNAVKYMGRPGTIFLESSIEPGKMGKKDGIVLKVRDDGLGMDEKTVSHAFERFYRADDKRSEEGSGLGLSIAKWIVESHGGKIWVESKKGEGTCFTIWLPWDTIRTRG